MGEREEGLTGLRSMMGDEEMGWMNDINKEATGQRRQMNVQSSRKAMIEDMEGMKGPEKETKRVCQAQTASSRERGC